MLSVSSIGSASGASNYYGKDDYYVSGEADSPGLSWGGEGAKKAGLTGLSTPESFRQVLDGSHPAFNGGSLGKPNENHKAGWDLTFSAPKTVSMMALVGGDKRLMEAHREANSVAMAYAEKHFSITRVRNEGKVDTLRTGNLVFASTEHQTSRAGDPQLHTHNIVANKTYDEKAGAWRAVESAQLFKNQKTLGLIYRAALAEKVMNLGYNVSKDNRDGTFEIAGIDRKSVEVFSQRHVEIERKMEQLEKEKGRPLTPLEREAVVLKDRPKKLDHPRGELEMRWKAEADRSGMSLDSVAEAAKDRGQGADVSTRVEGVARDLPSRITSFLKALTGRQVAPHDPYAPSDPSAVNSSAATAASFGVRVLEQHSTVFSKHAILDHALRAAPAGVTAEHIEAHLGDLASDKRLQVADKTVLDGLTTEKALSLENGIIERIHDGKRSVAAIATGEKAIQAIAKAEQHPSVNITLDDSQRVAALKLMTSEDRYTGIQGFAGVGKTAMFKVLKEAAAGEQFIGLAAQHDAAQVLQKGAGIKSQTIESYLLGAERVIERNVPEAMSNLREANAQRTLLVDESSMKSNIQMERLMNVVEQTNIKRVIFVGDERQIGSVEAGAPFSYALQNGLDHGRMENIRRQSDLVLRSAVHSLAEGNATEGIQKASPYIAELGPKADEKEYTKAAHDEWSALRAQGRDAALIVPTNALRASVSNSIRQTLIKEGVLMGDAEQRSVLRSVNLSSAQMQQSKSYEQGQVLLFHSADRNSGAKKEDALTIVGMDHRNNTLIADRADGDRLTIDLDRISASKRCPFNVYRAGSIQVQDGEKLVWDRLSQKKSGGELTRDFKVGQSFTLLNRDKGTWTIKDDEGKTHQVKSDDPALKHISHGYAETADRSQGKTYQNVIAVLGSNHGLAATASRLYVQMSRSAETFKLITNETRTLITKLNLQDGLNHVANRELVEAVTQLEQAKHEAVQISPELVKEDGVTPEPTSEAPASEKTHMDQDSSSVEAKAPDTPAAPNATPAEPSKSDDQREKSGPEKASPVLDMVAPTKEVAVAEPSL